jgi:CSLREA domain-containing protein
VISGNTTTGVSVSTASQGNAILANSIYGNSGIGIDLNANGVTPNDGAKTAGAGNQLMDHPVFTSARARGNQLTVAGYVGSAAGQSTFANARVEVFASDVDAGGFGEGQTYLGFVTTDASGNFSATFTMTQNVLAVGTRLTGTATDGANNTSEFGANFSGLVVDLVVNHNGDAVDANPGDGICQTATAGQCSLRAAIQEVNALAVQPSALTIAFALPGCSAAGQAACIITPPSALPALSKAAVIDGQTQPGWTLTPMVELVGSSAPAGTTGLQLQAASSAVRGLVVGGFNLAGVSISANSVSLQGNVIGLQGNGTMVRGNGTTAVSRGGVLVMSGTGVVIGGNTAAQRNIISGNGGAGIWVDGGSVTVTGNYIGTTSAGTAAAGNGRWGIHLAGGGPHQLGGAGSGEGNVVSGHVVADTGGIYVATPSVTIRGNRIGTNAAGTAYLPNGDGASTFASGIDLRSGSGHVVGGSATGEANLIAGNQGHGIRVTTQTSRLSANSITNNLWRGIDLGGDNVTANDGALNGAQPNNGMDHAVVTGAGIDGAGTSITVFGHVGTGSGQAVFAGARVEVFKANNDGSGYGQGATYLGFLTADANGRFFGALAIPLGAAVVGDAITATATDAAGNTSEFGPNWTSTTTAGLSPASFNAFETDTSAGALTGVIRSKVAGTAGPLAVLALDSAGTAPHAGFTGSVQLNWLDARDDSGPVTGSCRASWLDLGAAGTASFSNNNRVDVTLTPPANSTRSMRLKMTYAGPGGTVVACSNDAFAALPAQLAWLGASDTNSATAGNTRTLDNVAASGGVVHQAGRPFTLRAQALTSGGLLMPAYDGTPALTISSCVLPAACTPGALGGGNVAASAGLYTHNSVTYSEVGAVAVALADTSYANVDSGDTAAGARTISSSALAVGRFVPDSYALTIHTAGVLATASASCLSPGSGATFNGQGFGWATTPQVTVTARNAAGATTLHWTSSLMKLAPGAGLVPTLAVANAGSATLAASYAATTVQDLSAGQVRLQAGALDRFVLDTSAGAPQPSTTPTWQWQLAVTDSAEAGVAGNPQPSGTATQGSVLFDQGGTFHSSRLALATAHGDARSGVRMLMQLQRYTAAGWVTMTEDRGCVTVQRNHLEMDTPSGVFTSAGVCAAPLSTSATTDGGRAWLALPATPGGAPGRLAVRVAGTAASGSACSPAGAVQPVASLGMPWLTGGSSGAGPQATATWGRPQRDLVLRREIW